MIESCHSVAEIGDDFDHALISVSPKQAWAIEVRDQIAEARRKMVKALNDLHRFRTITSGAYSERIAQVDEAARQSVILEHTALANSGGSEDLVRMIEAARAVIQKYEPNARCGETFHLGAVTYAKLRLPSDKNQLVKIVGDDLHILFERKKDEHEA